MAQLASRLEQIMMECRSNANGLISNIVNNYISKAEEELRNRLEENIMQAFFARVAVPIEAVNWEEETVDIGCAEFFGENEYTVYIPFAEADVAEYLIAEEEFKDMLKPIVEFLEENGFTVFVNNDTYDLVPIFNMPAKDAE